MFRYEPTRISCADCGGLVQERDKMQKGKTKDRSCQVCGTTFEYYTSKPRKFCSHKCANGYMNTKRSEAIKKKIVCLTCKKVFEKRPSDLKTYKSAAKNKFRYCSTACWKAKTQTISSLKKKAWGVFATFIKERDNWTCYTCGKYDKGATMHAGHYISRRHNATLFDEDNVHAQCAGCNMFRNGEPHIYTERIISENGQEFLLRLIAKSKETKKFTKQELLDICDTYKTI